MKTQRHAAILRLIRSNRIQNQAQLQQLLRQDGIEVTQATLSRDISELELAKISDPGGGAYYAVAPEGEVLRPALRQLLATLLVSVDGVGNMLVIRTPAGSANALGSALDRQGWKEVVGTLAGDDTILVITRSERARRAVAARLEELSGTSP